MINYEQLYYDFFMYMNDLQFSIAPDERHKGREKERREELADLLQHLMEEMLYMRDKTAGGDLYGKTEMET